MTRALEIKNDWRGLHENPSSYDDLPHHRDFTEDLKRRKWTDDLPPPPPPAHRQRVASEVPWSLDVLAASGHAQWRVAEKRRHPCCKTTRPAFNWKSKGEQLNSAETDPRFCLGNLNGSCETRPIIISLGESGLSDTWVHIVCGGLKRTRLWFVATQFHVLRVLCGPWATSCELPFERTEEQVNHRHHTGLSCYILFEMSAVKRWSS